jgi:anti-anti-sigma factor
MVQVCCARGWDLELERGPDWLFVRPRPADVAGDGLDLAEQIWSLIEQSFAHRLVLELDGIDRLNSELIGQLICLQKRVHSHDGMLRICGLSEHNQEVLEVSRLGGYLPCYRDREAAVMGHWQPRQPR